MATGPGRQDVLCDTDAQRLIRLSGVLLNVFSLSLLVSPKVKLADDFSAAQKQIGECTNHSLTSSKEKTPLIKEEATL